MGTFVTVRGEKKALILLSQLPSDSALPVPVSPLTPQLHTLWHWIDLGVHLHRVGRELEMEGQGHEPLRPFAPWFIIYWEILHSF